MKILVKFLILLAVVAAIVLGIFHLLASSILADDDAATPPQTEVVQPGPVVAPPAPPVITKESSYDSTSGDNSANANAAPAVNSLSCDSLGLIIAQLYNLRVAGKSDEEAVNFINDDNTIPDSQITSLTEFVSTLWKTDLKQLASKETLVAKVKQQCTSIAK